MADDPMAAVFTGKRNGGPVHAAKLPRYTQPVRRTWLGRKKAKGLPQHVGWHIYQFATYDQRAAAERICRDDPLHGPLRLQAIASPGIVATE